MSIKSSSGALEFGYCGNYHRLQLCYPNVARLSNQFCRLPAEDAKVSKCAPLRGGRIIQNIKISAIGPEPLDGGANGKYNIGVRDKAVQRLL
jgi:hypothetical protein